MTIIEELHDALDSKISRVYIAYQDASGIKEGDVVRVVRKCKSYQSGWSDSWVSEMDDFVNDGNVYTVSYRASGAGGFVLAGEEQDEYAFPFFALEKVEENDHDD